MIPFTIAFKDMYNTNYITLKKRIEENIEQEERPLLFLDQPA